MWRTWFSAEPRAPWQAALVCSSFARLVTWCVSPVESCACCCVFSWLRTARPYSAGLVERRRGFETTARARPDSSRNDQSGSTRQGRLPSAPRDDRNRCEPLLSQSQRTCEWGYRPTAFANLEGRRPVYRGLPHVRQTERDFRTV